MCTNDTLKTSARAGYKSLGFSHVRIFAIPREGPELILEHPAKYDLSGILRLNKF